MEFLSGLHPVVIHFPIVLFILYSLFEISNIFTNLKFSAVVHIILLCGVFAGVTAVLSGNMAASINTANISNSKVLEIIDKHETYATFTLWYFLFLLIFRTYFFIKKKITKKMAFIFALASVIGVILVYLTGMYGGKLVYKFGIGTDLIK